MHALAKITLDFHILGHKMASLQLKVGLVNIVRHYAIRVNSKTVEPIAASPLDSLFIPISDIYLDFQRITM